MCLVHWHRNQGAVGRGGVYPSKNAETISVDVESNLPRKKCIN